MIFGLWFFLAIAAGMFAHYRRDRNGVGWFLIALLFSPLVAFVLLAILPMKPWTPPVDPIVAQQQVETNVRFAIFIIVAVSTALAIATAYTTIFA